MCNATTAQQQLHYGKAALLLRTFVIICCLSVCCVSMCNGSAIRRPPTPNKTCAKFNEYCINHWDCCSNSCLSFAYRCTRNYSIYPFIFIGESKPAQATLDDILQANFGAITNAVELDGALQVPRPAQPVKEFHINIRSDETADAAGEQSDRVGATSLRPIQLNDAVTTAPLHNRQEAQQQQQQGEQQQQEQQQEEQQHQEEEQQQEQEKQQLEQEQQGEKQQQQEQQNMQLSADAMQAESTTIITTPSISLSDTTKVPTITAPTSSPSSSSSSLATTAPSPSTIVPAALETRSNAAETTTTTIPAPTVEKAAAIANCKEIGEKCYRNEECCTMRCHGFLHQCVT